MTSACGYSRLNFQESKSVIEDKIVESQTQSSLLSQNMAEEFAKGQGERRKDEFGIGRSYLPVILSQTCSEWERRKAENFRPKIAWEGDGREQWVDGRKT